MSEKSPFDEQTAVFDYESGGAPSGVASSDEDATNPFEKSAGSEPSTGSRRPGGAGWYVDLHGRSQGPLTQFDLERLILQGQLQASTLVWRKDLPDWLPLEAVGDLAALLQGVKRPSRPQGTSANAQDWTEEPTKIALDEDLDNLGAVAETGLTPNVQRKVPPAVPQDTSRKVTLPKVPVAGWDEAGSSDVTKPRGKGAEQKPAPAETAQKKGSVGTFPAPRDWWDTARAAAIPPPDQALPQRVTTPGIDLSQLQAASKNPSPTPDEISLSAVVPAPPLPAAVVQALSTPPKVTPAPLLPKARPRSQGPSLMVRIGRELVAGGTAFFEWVDDMARTRWGLVGLIGGGALFVMALILLTVLLFSRARGERELEPSSAGTVVSLHTARLDEPSAEAPLSAADVGEPDDVRVTFKVEKPRHPSVERDRHTGGTEDDRIVTLRRSTPQQPKPRRVRRDEAVLDDLLAGVEAENEEEQGGFEQAQPRAVQRTASRELPSRLTAEEIRTTMRELHPRVRDCLQKHREPGMLTLQVTVEPNGLASAAVVGEFRGTAIGRCIADGVPRLRFPQFAGQPMVFPYPFRLRTE